MPKENQYLIENKKPIELVQELEKYEIKKSPLSKAARSKVINKSGSNYLSESKEDYGPCVNSLCGCDCSSRECTCKNAEISICSKDGFKLGNLSASGRVRKEEIDAGGGLSRSLFRIIDHTGDARFLSRSVKGEINKDNVKIAAGANLVEFKSHGFEGRAGINVDTGISTSNDTFEAELGGFGFSVGKKNGISTPFGEIKIDKDECAIQ